MITSEKLLRPSRCALLLALISAVVSCGSDQWQGPEDLMHTHWPLIIAHRGYAQFAPENTLAAFSEAKRVASDMIELDYHHAKDGEQVVIHDSLYDRTTDVRELTGEANVPVARKTSALTTRLSAGRWFDPTFANEHVPFLHEALIHNDQLRSRTLIDHKTGDVGALLATIERLQVHDNVVVQSADWDFLSELRRRSPHIAVSALGKHRLTAEKLAVLSGLRPTYVAWNARRLDAESIASIHQLDAKVLAYTVNNPREVRRLLAAHVDGIITDQVEKVQDQVARFTR